MRVSEITVGAKVWTYVSDKRVLVEVMADRGGRGRRYTIKRCDNGFILPGFRAPSALHKDGEGHWDGSFTMVIDSTAGPSEVAISNVTRCPLCQKRAIVELTQSQKAAQTDGTTHVCHPSVGGCNHGFAS